MASPRPGGPGRSGRADDVVAAARRVLERDGADGLTMRSVADELQIKAPSLYKHVAGKSAIEVELISVALAEMGQALHDALDASAGIAGHDHRPGNGQGDDRYGDHRGARDGVADGGSEGPVGALLTAYRRHALANPNMYRLATAGRLPRETLPPGLEDWAGEPFVTVAGDPHRGRALWSLAHGMVVLELDGRYPAGSDLDETWAAGAAAFAATVDSPRPRRA